MTRELSRKECINILNKLLEFNLITNQRALKIIKKRDKDARKKGKQTL